MPYKDKDGILNHGKAPVSNIGDAMIPAGKGSWAKISGIWVGKHDLFESQPTPYQIGRNGNFFTALAFAEIVQPLFSVGAMKDLRGGSVIVRLFKPGTDQAVFYQLEKNRLTSKEFPDNRHTAYWVYMFEKAFAYHRMQYDLPAPDSGKPKDYLTALRCTTFLTALAMLVGKTRADELTRDRQPQVKAMERLNSLHFFDDYAVRAVHLILAPDAVDQDCFGVCGMASTIHVVLKFRPGRFADILHSIFNNEDFIGGVGKLKLPVKIKAQSANYAEVIKTLQTGPVAQGEPPVDIGATLMTRIDQYNSKMAFSHTTKPWAKLDFIVSRSLARMLKITDPALYNDQKTFTEKFRDPLKPGVDIVKTGDLAFTEAGIVYMLTDIIGVSELSFIPGIAGPEKMIQAVNNWFDKHHDKGPFAISAINPFYESKDDKRWWFFPDGRNIYKGLKTPPRDWVQPAWQPYEFAHWIVINGKIEDRTFWWIPIWTWGRQWEGRLHKKYTAGYLYSVILSYLPPE